MIPGIKGSANGDVLAIASRELEKAKAYAGKFDIPRAYGNYEALLEDPEIQAVYVPLPNSLHKEGFSPQDPSSYPVKTARPT